LHFRNPIGLAAGFDKDAKALLAWEHLGFGFAEIGTVTAEGQPGNPQPRVFRLAQDEALINRMGFPNLGAEAVSRRLDAYKADGLWPKIPLGINLGKSKITSLENAPADYLKSFRLLRSFADFIVINVSSPNTPNLRLLQQKDGLLSILEPLVNENRSTGKDVPLLVKIAPDLSEPQIDDVLTVIAQLGLSGIVATNTTLDKSSVALKEEGGLSGKPVRKKSTEIIHYISQATKGQLPIIGVGGIFTAADAQEKFEAGAHLVQLYTGFVYEGPLVVKQICQGLAALER
jgi:dihydroorotate dehydrogenase